MPGWILTGESEKDLLALTEALGYTGTKPRQVGGIGSCTLYTPCRKCRAVFEETISKRRKHPIMLQVRRLEPEAVRPSEYVVTPRTAPNAGAPWILVFERERDIGALQEAIGIGRG
jgi:hypothetical protein